MSIETFYHLSESSVGLAIVQSTAKRAREPDKYFSPRTPRSRAGEPNDKRICVAPTVHQCLGATPISSNFEGALAIYKLQCVRAIAAGTSVVEDASHSDEHWITDEVIAANGGEIPLSRVGVIPEPDVMQHLLYAWVSGKVVRVSDHEFEAWDIESEAAIPKWSVKIHQSSQSTDEEPLELPKWEW